MKAVRSVFLSEQKLAFEEFGIPYQPGPYQVVIKKLRSVVSAGTELANYTGLEPDTRVKGAWCAYPWNPGYGGVGEVVAVGERVKDVNAAVVPGSRVYGTFKHATHTVVDVNWELCVPVPESLDSTAAVMTRMCTIAMTAWQQSTVTLSDTVVIIGLGMVGNLAGQFYLQAGQRVIGIDLAASRRALAKKCGFLDAIDPSGISEEELFAKVASALGGQPPKVVVDAVGESSLVAQAIRMVEMRGQVVLLGTPRAPVQGNYTDILKPLHVKFLHVLGCLEWTIPLFKRMNRGPSTEGNVEMVFDLIRRGKIDTGALISHVIAPTELDSAYQGLLHRKDEYVGVVVDWENNPAPAAG